ncbi:MAG: hypothetical protein V3T31_00825 [candidate division Zixibacteria bacterium]
MHIQRILLLATAIWFSAGLAEARPGDDTASFRGEITHRASSDTVTVCYHLTPRNFDADSVVLEIWGDNVRLNANNYRDSSGTVLIYDRREPLPYENEWRRVYEKNEKLYFDGTIAIPIDGKREDIGGADVVAYYSDIEDSVQTLQFRQILPNGYMGMGMELWTISTGYYKSNYKQPLDVQGAFVGYGMEADFVFQQSRLSFSTSWSGFGQSFTFSEPFRLGYRRYIGNRHKIAPALYGAVKLSKLRLKRSPVAIKRIQWGVEAGVALETQFERIGYHYSTALGGYHTFELFIALASTPGGKIGTRYLLQRKDNLWMIRVAFHLDAVDLMGAALVSERENNRPLIQKAIAIAGILPSYIIVAPLELYSWIAGKDED